MKSSLLAFLFVLFLGMVVCSPIQAFERQKYFKDRVFNLKGFFDVSLGSPSGDLMTQEKNSWFFTVLYSDGTTQTGRPSPFAANLGLSAEFLFSGLGLELTYLPLNITESASVGSEEYESKSYSGQLIGGSGIYGGINYHFTMMQEDSTEFLFYLGAHFGYIRGGLIPYVSLADYFGVNPTPIPISGLSFYPNLGFEMVIDNFIMSGGLSFYNHFLKSSVDLSMAYNGITAWFSTSYVALNGSVGLIF